MPAVEANKQKSDNITVVKKMRDYSQDPAFQKKKEKAAAFLKKHGLPKSFSKSK